MKTRKFVSAILLFTILAGVMSGCKTGPDIIDRENYNPKNVPEAEVQIDYDRVDDFEYVENTSDSYLEFVFNVFNRCASDAVESNMMISPSSMLFALGMTAGGARENTLTQMTDVLCPGSTPEEMQAFSLYYLNQLRDMDDSISIANGVWINDERIGSDLNENYVDFVEKNYHGEVTREVFNNSTVRRINHWVEDNTDGMIDHVIDELESDSCAVLVNAIAFESNWAESYDDYQVRDMTFTGINGEEDVSMLCETGSIYYSSDKATAFGKYYEGYNFAFIGILPNDENADISDFASSFTANDYMNLMNGRFQESCYVHTRLPEFSFDYARNISEDLIALGMDDAFSVGRADFLNIAELSNGNNIYISDVLHNSFIDVNRSGTRAAAATTVIMTDGCTEAEPVDLPEFEVYLDRPFMFAIIDTNTLLPVFIGTVNHISE